MPNLLGRNTADPWTAIRMKSPVIAEIRQKDNIALRRSLNSRSGRVENPNLEHLLKSLFGTKLLVEYSRIVCEIVYVYFNEISLHIYKLLCI